VIELLVNSMRFFKDCANLGLVKVKEKDNYSLDITMSITQVVNFCITQGLHHILSIFSFILIGLALPILMTSLMEPQHTFNFILPELKVFEAGSRC
jgi:hypothetical protein